MGLSWVFAVILYLFIGCDGFLLDDRNKPSTTSVSFLTDQHYNALFNLIVTERQSRSKLEQQLVRLEQELLATQQGVTDIYHTSANNNATLELEAKNWNTIRIENNDLKNRYNLLEYKFNSLSRNHSNLENYTKVLEQEVASLKQLKGVTDLQTVLSVRNETNILREELKITNNSLNSVKNEAEARKQDFVALLNKADSIEHKLEFSVKALDNNINNVSETLHYQTELYVKQVQNEMQKYRYNQSLTFKHFQENLTVVEGNQNVSIRKLNLEIHDMSNRAAFTVCAGGHVYKSSSTILFPIVQTRHGVSDLTLSAFGTSGIFRCQKSGLYLISAYLNIDIKGYVRFDFYKNLNLIAYLYFSLTADSTYQTSSISTVQYLNTDDTIYVKAGSDTSIYGGPHSCISFVQLTN